MTRLFRRLISAFALSCLASTTLAQSNPFGLGWTLDNAASSLQFQSIKNGATIETSSFATLSGAVSPDGDATLTVLLDSVDTKVDLRNVRMRFLFFETFQHAEATISARIDPALIADLAETRRKTIPLPFTLNLHGVTKTLTAQLAVTLIGDDLVAVSTAQPVNISVADFNLMAGLEKLQDAANVTIVPSSSINFDFIFRLNADTTGAVQTATAPAQTPAQTPAPTTAALETQGDFSQEACLGRFEILSRTDDIYFAPGSARLEDKSAPLLNAVADIVARCPGLNIQIAGHTDSIGGKAFNQQLSERRAGSVVTYLTSKGIPAGRMIAVGFGEDRPIADNATKQGRWKNRRIEFSVPKS